MRIRFQKGVTTERGDRMKIGFIGAGKVGFTLGKYIMEHHGCVSGYYSRNEKSAKEASDFTYTKYYDTIETLVKESDALFLTVPDGAIEDVWNSLKCYSLTDKLVCHCSGAKTSAVFSEIDQVGAFGYSIHPLFAVSSKLQSYQDISQAYFTIEGNERYLDYWKSFFEQMGNSVQVIDSKQKALYHCAAVVSSNLVTGLYNTAVDMLQECGFEREKAAKALMPLFLNNACSIAKSGVVDALTGPIERADIGTIKQHMEVMSDKYKIIYTELSKSVIDIAKEKHPDRDYKEIANFLEGKNETKNSFS